MVPVHLQACATANLVSLIGDHHAECRSLSSIPRRELGTPGSGPVCPSGVSHITHVCMCVCVREHMGRCMHMGVCMGVFVRESM